MAKVIDATPTWVGILPTIRVVIENSKNPVHKEAMWEELKRACTFADAHVSTERATTNLQLYHLDRKGSICLDEVASFVIAAVDVDEARRMAAESHGDESYHTWLDPKATTCELIGQASQERSFGVVCRDFRAG
jgi:hypothetical protein